LNSAETMTKCKNRSRRVSPLLTEFSNDA
jgi:hypothetical protein